MEVEDFTELYGERTNTVNAHIFRDLPKSQLKETSDCSTETEDAALKGKIISWEMVANDSLKLVYLPW